jgi:cytochrome c oxidase assembly protein subunit 15
MHSDTANAMANDIPARAGMEAAASPAGDDHLALRIWLYGVAALIFAMVLVGGATRLTDSGLSITEWKPLLGAIPPLSEADWQDAFRKYKEIPEYKLINRGMSLADFKAIYWWEWAHRFLGRFIGVAFFVPFAVFWFIGAIPKGWTGRLLGLFALGGLQGALGWYMVMSGLSERTDVSQYRLTAHLALAVLIFGAVLWTAFGLARNGEHAGGEARTSLPAKGAALLVAAVFLQIMLGGLVAGTDAGLSHNTWPLMDGAIVPDGLTLLQPWWRNIFENVLTIQFNHRMAGYLIALLAFIQSVLIWRREASASIRLLAVLVAAAVLAQIALGVLTLLNLVPIGLALTHQGGAVLLFALALYQLFLIRRSNT